MQKNLWNYCLNLYARPGVEHACLNLQSQGLDVCLLLCAAWLQELTVACSETGFEQLNACAQPWRSDVIQPLRKLRTKWREPAKYDEVLAALRSQVKQLELEAERALLQRLESMILGWPSTQSKDNCDWLKRMANSIDHPDCDALQTLRDAINRTPKSAVCSLSS